MFGSWNIRGLNDPSKQVEVRKFILDNSLSLCGIVETTVRFQNLDGALRNCLPANWEYIRNVGSGLVGRAFCTWNPVFVKADLISSSDQQITCRINHVNTLHPFIVTLVYGLNFAGDRAMTWNELRGLHFSVGSDPWLLIGDFNAVRRLNERSNHDNFDHTAAASFNSCIEDIDIDDLPAKGFWFSWSNRSGGMGLIKSRIDRAMVNHVWQDTFTESEAVFTAPGISDHCPLLVSIIPYRYKRKPF